MEPELLLFFNDDIVTKYLTDILIFRERMEEKAETTREREKEKWKTNEGTKEKIR